MIKYKYIIKKFSILFKIDFEKIIKKYWNILNIIIKKNKKIFLNNIKIKIDF